MLFFLIFIAIIIVIGGISTIARLVAGPERARLEASTGPALAEDQEQDFGDLCADSTSLCLELYKDYGAILKTLKRRDGFSPIEGEEALTKATTSAVELVGRVEEVAEAFEWMPEDAEDYLQFLLENANFLVELDESEDEGRSMFQIGNDNDAATGVMEQARERVETMLLASFDFGRRMLDFKVGEYVEESHGSDTLKVWRNAVHAAEKNM